MHTPPDPNTELETLLNYLWQSHGFDFTGYRRSSLTRRVNGRMQMLPVASYSEYTDYLKHHPEEFFPLFNTIEINFTSFFRDTSTWEYITTQIVPHLITSKPADKSIRIWSAGCASGEEIYTLAIVLAEALGEEQFRSRVQIFGTDVDKEVLKQARQGTYSSSAVMDIPGELLEKYFHQDGDRYVFRQDLRRSIIFCHHNLIQDAPMSKIDLLVCRNVLIYFNIETQVRVLVRFLFSLKESGFLFLGHTEIVPEEITALFSSVNLQHRVYTKLPSSKPPARLLTKALKKRQPGVGNSLHSGR